MTIWADFLTSTADILGTSVENGEAAYDLGDVRDDVGIAVEATSWGLDGFVSLPNDPADGECARALYLVDGDEKIVIGSKDARYSDKVGTLEAGDRAIVSAGNQRFLMKQGNESVTLYTVNQDTGNSMMVSLSGADGVNTMVNGNSVVTQEDEKIVLAVNGGGYLEINKDGVFIQGKMFVATAGRGHLGVEPPSTVAASQGIGLGVPGTTPVTVCSTNWTVSK